MSAQVPAAKPQETRNQIVARILKAHPNLQIPKVCFVGVRGYYKKSMGNPTKNDRMIYDDAMFILTENGLLPFNANVDPGAFRKGIANLVPGVYNAYKFDLHNGKYLAICQRAANVAVLRDGDKMADVGMFGINIHKGGINQVSSLGCQTIPPSQWDQFILDAQTVCQQAYGSTFKKLTYTYILLEN